MSACPLPSRVAGSCLCQEEEEDGGDGVFLLLSLGFAGSWLCVLQPVRFDALGLSLGTPRGELHSDCLRFTGPPLYMTPFLAGWEKAYRTAQSWAKIKLKPLRVTAKHAGTTG